MSHACAEVVFDLYDIAPQISQGFSAEVDRMAGSTVVPDLLVLYTTS